MRLWVNVFFGLAKPIKEMQSAKKLKNSRPERVVVFTHQASVVEQIANLFSLQVDQLKSEQITTCPVKNSIVIFDMTKLRYKDVINFMKKYNQHGNVFRFKPAHHPILIGSDSSTRMGEIKQMKN